MSIKTTLTAALISAFSFAPVPMLTVAPAHAQESTPMEAAGTAGEKVDKKAMKSGSQMSKGKAKSKKKKKM